MTLNDSQETNAMFTLIFLLWFESLNRSNRNVKQNTHLRLTQILTFTNKWLKTKDRSERLLFLRGKTSYNNRY